MIMYSRSYPVNIRPSSWKQTIRRPHWQEEISLEVLTMKLGLFVSGIKVVLRQYCIHKCAMFSCRLQAIDKRQQIKPTKRKNGTLSTFPGWLPELSEQRHRLRKPKTDIFFFWHFSKSFPTQHDYSSGTQRENTRKHQYKMKPGRRHNSASYPGLITEGRPFSLLCSPFFSVVSVCVTSFFHLYMFHVFSMLSIPTYLTWIFFHFFSCFLLLF